MNRLSTAAAALVLTLLAAGPARADGAYFEGNDPNPAPLKYSEDVLLATLTQQLARQKVATVKNLVTGATDVAKLSRAEKVAVLYLAGSKPGAEFNLMIEENGQYLPVKTWWDGDTITFKTGAPRKALYGKASSKEEIQKKYGIGPFVDSGARWDNDSLFIVETALATLSPAELEGVAGLPFHRMVKDPSNKVVVGVAIAMYVPEKSQIELYDFGIDADKRRFLGPLEKPVPTSVASVVHECGHAISRKGTRDTRLKAVEAKKEYDEINARLIAGKKTYDEDKATYARTKDAALGKALSERVPALKQLIADLAVAKKRFEPLAAQMTADESKGSGLERALDAKLPFKSSPTIYGRTSLAESFAECLSLHKLDRAALDRAAPGISAWFESPEYAALLQPAGSAPLQP